MADSKEVAFSDLEKAITVGEFEAILQIVIESRDRFKNSSERFEKAFSSIGKINQDMAKKHNVINNSNLITKMESQAKTVVLKEFHKDYKLHLENQAHIVNFLNRFTGEEERIIEFNFLKK